MAIDGDGHRSSRGEITPVDRQESSRHNTSIQDERRGRLRMSAQHRQENQCRDKTNYRDSAPHNCREA
jgi:hypothetical protein